MDIRSAPFSSALALAQIGAFRRAEGPAGPVRRSRLRCSPPPEPGQGEGEGDPALCLSDLKDGGIGHNGLLSGRDGPPEPAALIYFVW